jgi:hypothetical protein
LIALPPDLSSSIRVGSTPSADEDPTFMFNFAFIFASSSPPPCSGILAEHIAMHMVATTSIFIMSKKLALDASAGQSRGPESSSSRQGGEGDFARGVYVFIKAQLRGTA